MDDIKTHKAYVCIIAFYEPKSGPVRILARDKDHAEKLLQEMLPHVRDLKVLEIVDENLIDQPMVPDEEEHEASSEEEVTPEKKDMH